MTTETGITIITPRTLDEAKDLARELAGARTIPEALQKSPADVLAIVMAGSELGLAPMQSVRALVLIKGKPTLSADAMGALVKARRDVCEYLQMKHSDATRAVYETKRAGDPSPTTMGFTIEEARQAGLNGDNWKRFPAAMLRARALSAICRAVYPDLLLGVYDPDELAPQAEKDVTPAPAPEAPKRKRLNIVDVTPAPEARPSPPMAEVVPEGPVVGWGKHAARTLASLTGAELAWYESDAAAKSKGGATEWVERLAAYRAESARRAALPQTAEVAP